jgi:hypothetical protein
LGRNSKRVITAAGTKQWTGLKDLRFQCLKDLNLRREGESEEWWKIRRQD